MFSSSCDTQLRLLMSFPALKHCWLSWEKQWFIYRGGQAALHISVHVNKLTNHSVNAFIFPFSVITAEKRRVTLNQRSAPHTRFSSFALTPRPGTHPSLLPRSSGLICGRRCGGLSKPHLKVKASCEVGGKCRATVFRGTSSVLHLSLWSAVDNDVFVRRRLAEVSDKLMYVQILRSTDV